MISALDLFSVGIGPSSSHTVGPMRAAGMFTTTLRAEGKLQATQRITVDLHGSLGATGRGHGSDTAVVLGLLGFEPETIDPSTGYAAVDAAKRERRLDVAGQHPIDWDATADMKLHFDALPEHPNGMVFTAIGDSGVLARRTYYSVGGGFVVEEGKLAAAAESDEVIPFPFTSGTELLALCEQYDLTISEIVRANERVSISDAQLDRGLLQVWDVMQECVNNGCNRPEETLPGGLGVWRRAPKLFQQLTEDGANEHRHVLDWVNLFALAVNEENASGQRVVTAPTNGAAGIIPAVLHYYTRFTPGATQAGVLEFLLTASAIGMLFKRNASISGAEVGCQGEVGSACSMAAAGLAAALGGTPAQIENAAEIGIEHNLGLTCDPVGGLVQIPCIERNAIASNKAINAASMALRGDGTHRVSLDQAIQTMRDTGADMKSIYKETSLGGLAVNVVEC